MRKTFDKEFKLEAVRMVKEDGKKVAEVARELDLAEQTLYNWVTKYNKEQEAGFVGSGNLKSAKKNLLLKSNVNTLIPEKIIAVLKSLNSSIRKA